MTRIFTLLILMFLCLFSSATHNRAGEITYKHISGLTYQITLITYTYTLSPADRPSLSVNWGDNTNSIVNRTQKINMVNDITKNVYTASHTYLGQGVYKISMEDPNRNGGIRNIPNSINVPFYIETELVINPFLGINNSPDLLNPPIDNGCVGSPYYHNPSAFDQDGDSLSYELVPCKESGGNNIFNYINPVASVYYGIDAQSGTLTWNSPVQIGEYNIAIKITEWRYGVKIGYVIRDMQIDIGSCSNHPPVINQIMDTCVEVGSQLVFWVVATDQDNDLITLTGTGGPLVLSNNPAFFAQPTTGIGIDSSFFSWTPDCSNVKKNSYQMNFKAEDNDSVIELIDYEDVKIRVIGPSPKNLTAIPKGNHIELNWQKSVCSNVVRYDIYRHNGYLGYIPSYCETGVPSWTAYQKVGSTNSWNDTTYIDNGGGFGLMHGPDYCYMVVALFPDSAESYPSLEACASLIKDLPVITHNTIDSTSANFGIVKSIWSKPTDLDFSQTPGPFKYLIYHSDNYPSVALQLVDSFASLDDTIFILNNQNTAGKSHYFKVDLIHDNPNNRFKMGETQLAQSIFMNAAGSDNKITLSWNENVPWQNNEYIIYRKNSLGVFDSIGATLSKNYTDTGLINGQSYCYLVKSRGEYTSNQFMKPLINYSQEICAEPIDNIPPCPPKVLVNTDCRLIENTVRWTNPNNDCADDVVAYKLYYSNSSSPDFVEIYSTTDLSDTTFVHSDIANVVACYSVVAIDSFNNQSEFSVPACIDVDSCELYQLPNVFTPNGDGINDYFTPFPYDFVEGINIYIYNRWGNLVFYTDVPDINWDGKDIATKQECSDGVYFYICTVSEYTLKGIRKREIRGTITIMRN